MVPAVFAYLQLYSYWESTDPHFNCSQYRIVLKCPHLMYEVEGSRLLWLQASIYLPPNIYKTN